MKLIDEIKKDLSKRVVFGNSLSYDAFLQLYSPYLSLIPEHIFAIEVMNLSSAMFHSLKYDNENITIKPFFFLNDSLIEEIRNEMEKKFKNSQISYKVFKENYEEYKSMITEIDFAKLIFDINNSAFYKFKDGLYNAKVFTEEENLFLNYYSIIYDKFYNLYKNKEINYNEFLELYKEYQDILNETDFAACLGISYNSYRTLKRCKRVNGEGYKVKLFAIPKADLAKIDINFLKKNYANKKINYNDFLELYQKYGFNISEDIFARILGIQFGTFQIFKRKKQYIP